MSSKGITLIELIVALSIFALIVPVATGLLVSIMQNQRSLLTQQDLLNQANYAVEYMGRAMRDAIKSSGTDCLSKTGENYEAADCGGGIGTGIKFINHTDNDSCQEFCLSGPNGYLEEIKNNGAATALTPGNYAVASFKIIISPDPSNIPASPKYQPRVTFYLDLKENTQASNPPEVKIQTTVSQRNLNL